MKYKIILECIIYENFDVDLDVMKQIYFAECNFRNPKFTRVHFVHSVAIWFPENSSVHFVQSVTIWFPENSELAILVSGKGYLLISL